MRPGICMEERGRAALMGLELCLRLRRRRWGTRQVISSEQPTCRKKNATRVGQPSSLYRKIFTSRLTASRESYFSLDGAGESSGVSFLLPAALCYWTWKTTLVRRTSLLVSLPNAESV